MIYVLGSDDLAGADMAKDDQKQSLWRSLGSLQESANRAGPAAAAAYTLIGAVVLLGAGGYALDRWLNTGPWGVFIGLLLGVAVGFYELIKSTWQRPSA